MAHTSERTHTAGLSAYTQPLPVVAAGILSFGVTMLIMSAFYIEDLEMLRQLPEAVWLFICGVPSENPIVLPLLITVGVGSILISAGLFVSHRLYSRRT